MEEQIVQWWEANGRQIPPPDAVKARAVKQYGATYGIRALVETGTFIGTMLWATKDHFDRIYSIELGVKYYEAAKVKFASYPHIFLYQGDSSQVLPYLLLHIDEPCVFWLDGHYSGFSTAKGDKDTPIREELQQILNHKIQNHVILIDDARLFTGQNDYPTIEQVRQLIANHCSDWVFEVKDDIIRIHNK